MEHAGELLRFFREKNRWSQKDAAVRIGIRPQELSRLEHGYDISPSYLAAIERSGILDKHQFDELRRRVIIQQVEKDFGVDLSAYFDRSLDEINVRLMHIHKLKLDGSPVAVIALLPEEIKKLQALRRLYPSDRERIDRMLAFALIDLVDAHTEISSEVDIQRVTEEYLRLLHEVRYALKRNDEDQELWELVDVLGASVLHVAKETALAAEIARRHRDKVTTSLPKVFFVRMVALANAISFEKKEQTERTKQDQEKVLSLFEQDKEVLLNVQHLLRPADFAQLSESFSRTAHVLGNLDDEVVFLAEAKAQYQQSVVDGTYRMAVGAAIARTDFMNLVSNPDVGAEILVPKAMEVLSILGTQYDRHRMQVLRGLYSHKDTFISQLGRYLLK